MFRSGASITRAIMKPVAEQDGYHLVSREQQVVLVVETPHRSQKNGGGGGSGGGFFLACQIWGECSTIHSPPELFFFSFFF